MRRSHRGSRNGVRCCCRGKPCRQNARARSKDIEARSIIGKRRAGVGRSCRTNSYGKWFAGRRSLASIGVAISRRDNKYHTITNTILYCNIKRRRSAATKTHVGNRRRSGNVMRNNPVDAGNNSRCRARATAIKHANRNDGNTWCHSIITATNCSGNMRAVAVAVFSAVAVAHR